MWLRKGGHMQRPKVNEVTWDYFHYNHTPEFSYRVMISREHGTDYFKLRYIKNGQDKIKYFYGETAWMDINRFVYDLGDRSFSVDNVLDDMVDSFVGVLGEGS
jgi:hypothetical protein